MCIRDRRNTKNRKSKFYKSFTEDCSSTIPSASEIPSDSGSIDKNIRGDQDSPDQRLTSEQLLFRQSYPIRKNFIFPGDNCFMVDGRIVFLLNVSYSVLAGEPQALPSRILDSMDLPPGAHYRFYSQNDCELLIGWRIIENEYVPFIDNISAIVHSLGARVEDILVFKLDTFGAFFEVIHYPVEAPIDLSLIHISEPTRPY